jgi:general secretion pathway protein B
MSFILDALKKSELERQRQSVPGLMDARMAAGRGRLPVWAIALAVLLGINLIVLTVVLTRGGRQAPPPRAPRTAVSAAPAAPDHFSPLDNTQPVFAPEVPVTAADNPPPAPVPVPESPSRIAPLGVAGTAGTARGFHRPDPILTEEATREDVRDENEEVLPSISEISLSGAQTLPELHLDVHVYATKPAERFVYINMRKYREGAVLQEGPTVERIRRDGVVLDFQGLRFVLPRQP